MKVTICTTHGKAFSCADLRLTPEEQDFDVDDKQLAVLRRAASPKKFIGTDKVVRGGQGVLRIKEAVKPAAPSKGDADKGDDKAKK